MKPENQMMQFILGKWISKPVYNTFSVSKLLDLEVFLMGGGCERTEEEFRNLLKKAGFKMSQVIHTQESISVIEAIPV